jgi:ATP-dependent protease ClpP protease subunit
MTSKPYYQHIADGEKNCFIITGHLEQSTVDGLIAMLSEFTFGKSSETIVIFINNCTGGGLDGAFSIYDIIKLIKETGRKIKIIALNRCFSAAIVVFMAGDERIAGKHSEFLLHPAASSIESGKTDELQERINYLRAIERRVAEIYASGGKKQVEEFLAMIKLEHLVTALEALELGIVTRIV